MYILFSTEWWFRRFSDKIRMVSSRFRFGFVMVSPVSSRGRCGLPRTCHKTQRHGNNKDKSLRRQTWTAKMQIGLASTARNSDRVLHFQDKLEQLKYKSDWSRRRAILIGCFTRKINLVSLNEDPALLVRSLIFTCDFEISVGRRS